MNSGKFLYWITAIIATIFLYVGFVYFIIDPTSLRQETLDKCMEMYGEEGFSFSILCGKEHTNIAQPTWIYLFHYLPAGLLLGFSRSLNINFSLPVKVYPDRIVIWLVWLGLIAATLAITLTLWISVYLVDKPPLVVFMPTIVLSGWLLAPLLFQYLLAPKEADRHMSALKVGLALMVITPILTVSYSFLNTAIEALLSKSVVIS